MYFVYVIEATFFGRNSNVYVAYVSNIETMARSSSADKMKKDTVVQTRVSKNLRDQLEAQAEQQGDNLAEYLRTILDGIATPETKETGINLKHGLLADLYCVGTANTVEPNGDRIECKPVTECIHTNWDDLTDTNVRETIFHSSTVYIAGEGSSLGVGKWFAGRLNDQGVDAYAAPAEDIPVKALDAKDTLVIISRGGKTDSVVTLADRAQATGATMIAVTKEKTDLADSVTSLSTEGAVIPVPEITEASHESYATRSVFLQMGVLHVAVLAGDPDKDTIEAQFTAVHEFIHDHLQSQDDLGDEEVKKINDEEWLTTTDEDVRLDPDSQFWRAANALDREGDLASNPLITGLGRYHPIGRAAVQSHMAFLHTQAAHVSIGSTVESLMNVLHHGDCYMVTVLPHDPEEWGSDYSRCWDYLSNCYNKLSRPRNSPGLRVLAFSFNPDYEQRDEQQFERLEDDIQRLSEFRNDSIIVLPDRSADLADDGFVNDLVVMAAHYLLVYAILDRRWPQDRYLRDEVMHGPSDRRMTAMQR